MRTKLAVLAASMLFATPAWAGIAVPTPEADAGLAGMALLGAGLVWLKRRRARR
jgi:MYXO-CTERM domain-containing protein